MRDDNAVLHPDEFAGFAARRADVGRPEFRLLTRGRVALLLAAAIALPWLPIRDGPAVDPPLHRARVDTGGPIWRLAISPDGSVVATADEQGCIALRPVTEGRGTGHRVGVRGTARALAFSPDGRDLAVGRLEPDIILCGRGPGGRERPLGLPVPNVTGLAFAPDGRTLAIVGAQQPGILLWDLEAGRPRMTLRGHASAVVALAFSPDGRSLASAAGPDRDVLIWDLDAGRPRHRLPAPRTGGLAYSPDGHALATVGLAVGLWDARTGRPLRTVADRPVPHYAAAFSADGRLLATADGDGTVGLWSPGTGRELRRLDGRAGLLRGVAFPADGRTLLTVGNDGDLRSWALDDLGALE